LVRCTTPAILLPYPQAADDHQWANATYFVQQGGGLVMAESALPALRAEVLRVLQSDALLEQFRSQLGRQAQEDCLAAMVPDLEQLASGSPAGRRSKWGEVPA
jgi:UDP-N-acetylglucosamine--N-acetylmuramyl-(pentapeptide) pyrophosphoryl-undecaprenol N-acetylglucosamine transferase